jgi:hypothetical protein
MYLTFENNKKILKRRESVFFDAGITPDLAGNAKVTQPPGFQTVPLFDVYENRHPDRFSNNIFNVPVSGVYLIYSKIRPLDNTNHQSFGQGVHTDNFDGAWFIWGNTYTGLGVNRNGLQNTRIAKFNVDDPLRLYSYFQANCDLSSASLQIYLLEEI